MTLNEAQKKAVVASHRPLLIVAGAGTGKTRTLTERIIYLIETGVKPDQICALTFTNKAAKEMLERVSARVREMESSPLITTFHSFGARILRKEGGALGRQPNFVIFDDHDSFSLIKKILKSKKILDPNEKPSVVYEKISAIKNGMVKFDKGDLEKEEVKQIFEDYEKALRDHNAFDFDDLIDKVVWIFRNKPEVLTKYQRKFPYLLVDEYQDINHKQYELIKLLAGGGNLSVVGDDQQTIYSWRGSDIEIFLSFRKDWLGNQIIFLEENYRSTSNIIQAATGMVKNNEYQISKTGVEWEVKKLWTRNLPGEKVKIVEMAEEEEEADWIAGKIRSSQNLNSTAVLYRTNAQSRAIEQALLELEVPYLVFGGIKFYERLEVKDILAALRWVFNPADQISYERLEKNLGKSRLKEFSLKREEGIKLEPAELISFFIKTTGYLNILEKNHTNFSERQENIAELIGFADKFKDLGEFLEKVTLLQSTDSLKQNETGRMEDCVQLMTIHLAKGLEFDKVFVAGVNEGLLPHHRSLDSKSETEEERRLLYVAMTRARQELNLSFYDIPSRFLSEIPPEFTEFAGNGGALDAEERYIVLD